MAHYLTTKTFDHNDKLNCSYRIWNSDTDDRFIHGHLLQIKLIFSAVELDDNGQAVELDEMGEVVEWIKHTFGNTICIAADDPYKEVFFHLANADLARVRVLDGVGCENFSRAIWHKVDDWLEKNEHKPRVLLRTVEVIEHHGHSGLYIG